MSTQPRRQLLTSLVLVSLWSPAALAKGHTNFDAFLQQGGSKSVAADAAASAEARGLHIQHTEDRVGVPTFVQAQSPQRLQGVTMRVLTPDGAAREHLRSNAALYRLSGADVSAAQLKSVHDTGRGAVVAKYGQSIDGVEVFRSEMAVVMSPGLELVAMSGYLLPANLPRTGSFRLGATDVASRAFADLTGEALGAGGFVADGQLNGGYVRLKLGSNASATSAHALETARAKQVYYPTGDALEPAYYVEVNAGPKGSADSEYVAYVVSAVDGRLLMRNGLTSDEAFQYRVFAEAETASESAMFPFDGPQGFVGTPHPTGTPSRFQASLDPANAKLITLQNYPFTRNDPWLPANATQTTGNNVDAYADLAAPDGFQATSDLRATVTAPGVFDYLYELTRSPASTGQRLAAITNLFYLNNFLHDWYYDAGFDEAAGNAQVLNFGRGGLEGDSIKAEAQDFGGRNNANMSTPADGARPRMQMYVFDGVPELRVTSPSGLAGTLNSSGAVYGPQEFTLTGSVKVPNPTTATLGCNVAVNGTPTNPFAAGTFSEKIAVIDRGTCNFTEKVQNAQAAGAIGVIIANNAPGGEVLTLGGTPTGPITVPVMMMPKEDADAWKAALVADASTDIQVSMRRVPDLDRDGTIDNGIIAHEWGHYISNRLVANSAGLVNNQGRSMGEGWADFHALLLLTRDSDRLVTGNEQFQGVYSVAGYTQSGGKNNGYYYGIRRVPYSTDTSKNALTFKHIAAGVPLPTSHPVAGGQDGRGNSEVHNSGEVWATMLWECYTTLLNRSDLTFAQAQQRMKEYLVAAYKATPVAPTMLEARDALLSVALATDPVDHANFLKAFAKRGAGLGAKAPDRNSQDHVGVVESFEFGNNLEVVSVRLDDSQVGCDRDGTLDVGETGLLQVTVRNTGLAALSAFSGTVAATNATATLDLGAATLSFPALQPGQTATATLPVTLDAVNVVAPATLASTTFTVTFDEPSLPTVAKTATADVALDYDDLAGVSGVDTMDSPLSVWTSTTSGGNPLWKREKVGSSTVYRAPNLAFAADYALYTPWVTVKPGAQLIVDVRHRYSFEANNGGVAPWWDGGVIEASTDGVHWYDVFVDAEMNPRLYGGTGVLNYQWLYTGADSDLLSGGNPLGARPAFVGLSAGYPAFGLTRLHLRADLAGKPVQLRFRIGSDDNTGANGWDIDSIDFKGTIVETPFSARVAEAPKSPGAVCNIRPVADAGLNQSLSEFEPSTGNRRTVKLSGLGSFDPDGQPLTYQWRQLVGPPVALSSTTVAEPSFVADVPASTVYAFELVVSDGVDVSAPKVTYVTITNNNRAPVAVAKAPATADERTLVELDGSGSSDPDGEAIVFTWAQVPEEGKPTVALSDVNTMKPTFTAPEVTADTQLTFSLVVSDGLADSAVQTVAVTVKHVDRAPEVDAGEAQTVKARTAVTLTGTASDPDGDEVTYAWTQHAGETQVTLTGANTATASFTAPNAVRTAMVLHFDLTATANGLSSTDTVEVTVMPVNRAPVAHVRSPLATTSGQPVTLTGSGTDEDGDALTYVWKQLGGPPVTLEGGDTATPSFIAPEVSDRALMTFQLVVRDEALQSAPVTVEVTVLPVAKASGCAATGSASPLASVALLGLAHLFRRRRFGRRS